MTEAGSTSRRYLCGALYVAAGLAMAGFGVASLQAEHTRAMLALPGGMAVAVAGAAVVRESWRQSHLSATATNAAPVSQPQANTAARPAVSARSARRHLAATPGGAL